MARQSGTVIENQWTRGLITEATGLNFPEHAATDSDNVKYLPKGSVIRRMGIDIEGGAECLSYEDGDGVVKEFLWNAVAQSGGFTFLVLQKGPEVYFFEIEDSSRVSSGITNFVLSLEEYKSPKAGDVSTAPCAFTSGSGLLFIAHPECDPIVVRWDDEENQFEAAKITIRIRDFEGVEDDHYPTRNPTNLSDEHHYNLKNQGWDQKVLTGTTSNEKGEGGKISPSYVRKLDWEPVDTI